MTGKAWAGVRAASSVVLAALLAGCLTARTEFQAVGERELFREDFSGTLHGWETWMRAPHFYARVKEPERSYFRFNGNGGATIVGSLVGDFRMEFDLRLEAAVTHEIATAMVNFRNYFDRRYCLLIEEQNVNLTGAWVKHSQLDDLQRVTIPTVLKKWYHYEIVAVGHHIRVFRDGRQMIDVEDPHATVTQGNIWFESWSRYSIADVQVWSLRDFVRVPKPEAAPAVSVIPAAAGKIALAVAEFDNLGLADYEASLLSDLFAAALLDTRAFRVADRRELGKVMAEQELQLSDIVSKEGAVKIGKTLAARYLATGSLGSLGRTYVMTVKVLDVITGETVAGLSKEFAAIEDIPRGLGGVAAQLAKVLAAR